MRIRDIAGVAVFSILLARASTLPASIYVGLFVVGYLAYIVATFWDKIINLRKF